MCKVSLLHAEPQMLPRFTPLQAGREDYFDRPLSFHAIPIPLIGDGWPWEPSPSTIQYQSSNPPTEFFPVTKAALTLAALVVAFTFGCAPPEPTTVDTSTSTAEPVETDSNVTATDSNVTAGVETPVTETPAAEEAPAEEAPAEEAPAEEAPAEEAPAEEAPAEEAPAEEAPAEEKADE